MACGPGCGHSPDDPEHVLPGEGVNDLLRGKSKSRITRQDHYTVADWFSAVAVDIDNVVALNAEDESQAKDVLKAWDDRFDEEKYLRSDAE